jgi:FKBP-type peptidyl-prolyl cis-trans isomerase
MRTLIVPALFGLILLCIALITRSGIAARENPGVPINSAMREAMNAQQLPAQDAILVDQRFPGAASLPSGIRYVVLQLGEGEAKPRPGQWVRVHYTAHFLDGSFFDSSREGDEGPFNFQLGTGRVIAGWDEIIPTMRRGERRIVIIPYWRAYGDRGIRGKVPRQATLVFDLELIDFR